MATMTPYITAASTVAAVNVALLVTLSVVWARNYRTFRTPLTLGLLGFAVVLLVENVVALAFFFSMGMLYAGSPPAGLAVLGMRLLQFLALVLLTYVTLA